MTHVSKYIVNKEGDYSTISCSIKIAKKNYNIWYKTSHSINETSDIFLIAALVPSMKAGEDIFIEGNISGKLYNSLDKIQDEYITYHPYLRKVKINANINNYIHVKEDSVTASFFTCGADSFYTLLKHESEINKIVYVHGFDVWLYEENFRSLMLDHLREVSKCFGKELVEVETNLHEFSDHFMNWDFYHCNALSSVAVLLSSDINKIYLGSAIQSRKFLGWCVSDIDKLFSTEQIEIIPDGFESSRLEKIKYIASNNVVLDHLRVCIERASGNYNCSKCEKCIRSMIPLYICGSLDKCKTFSLKEPLANLISKIKIENDNVLSFAEENITELQEGDVKNSLNNIINKYRQKHL